MGQEAHKNNIDAFDDNDDEKSAKSPDADLAQYTQASSREGGHALLQPLVPVGGGDMMATCGVKMQAEEHCAEELYYVMSAAGENHKTNRNMELPQHKALRKSSHPEDSMGGDLVEYPVVFSSAISTWDGNEHEVATAKLSRVHLCLSSPRGRSHFLVSS